MSDKGEALTRAFAAFNKINAAKSFKTLGAAIEKFKYIKTKESGIIIVRTHDNKLEAIIPTGMTANKMTKVVEANKLLIEEFKTSNKENLKL